jgi:hypothetical protein
MSVAHGNEYSYIELDFASSRTRLLNLLPSSNRDAKLQCTLDLYNLSTGNVKYEALSYTWGDQSGTHELWIEDKVMKISQNLHVALGYLRDVTVLRTLWVDAVCINQKSFSEKNHQIRQMSSIYSSAAKVLIWVGESDSEINEAMEFLQDSRENRDRRQKPMAGIKKIFARPWSELHPD